MFKSILVVALAAIIGCTSYIEHEAPPKQKVIYSGGRHYNEWHDKVYQYCSQQPDPWRCAIKNGIAI